MRPLFIGRPHGVVLGQLKIFNDKSGRKNVANHRFHNSGGTCPAKRRDISVPHRKKRNGTEVEGPRNQIEWLTLMGRGGVMIGDVSKTGKLQCTVQNRKSKRDIYIQDK